jgi:16S rRNA (adenine1518-N6/adenine1519-N6)-dimethyltransferase
MTRVEDWRSFTISKMKELNLQAKYMRGLKGQHFLTKYKIVRKMVDVAELKNDDIVIEVGGGIGILTQAILEKVDHLTIVEKDLILVDHLNNIFGDSVTVMHDDALQYNFPNNAKLLSNLPYSVGTEILIRGIHSNLNSITVMLQKEVADRCFAQPGFRNFSRLSAIVQLHYNVQEVLKVPPTAFIPPPKVHSSVLHLTQKKEQFEDHKDLELLFQNLFNQKNKLVRKVIRGYLKKNTDSDLIENIPYAHSRIINLSIKQFQEILYYLKSINRWPITKLFITNHFDQGENKND